MTMINSCWTEKDSLPSFPHLKKDTKTDVLIIGGGMAGLLCAHEMRQAGVDYLLIEADRICSGVTRNTTAKITSQHGLIYNKLIREFDIETAKKYFRANEQALQRFRLLSKEFPCDFAFQDAYVYSLDSRKSLEQEMTVLEKIGAKAEFVDSLPLSFSTAGAIRFPKQAQFHPLKFAAGLAEGLNIREHTKALAFEGMTVLTEHGRIRASKIIVATHFPILNKHGAYFLKMFQHRSYVLALENAQNVDGMYLDASGSGLSFRNYGNYLLLGGGSHRTGKPGAGWKALEQFAGQNYPDSKEVCRWATQDCMTLDGIAYIGQYSRSTPDLYVATGFNKWGMTSSMVAAMILHDLVLGKESPYEEVFSPSRTVFRPQLASNALETAKNLLRPTKPRCPHLGCALRWNPNEHTWDCPCHGSRFTESGKLLDNPATGDLKQ